jgi:hypothetical protein
MFAHIRDSSWIAQVSNDFFTTHDHGITESLDKMTQDCEFSEREKSVPCDYVTACLRMDAKRAPLIIIISVSPPSISSCELVSLKFLSSCELLHY